MCATLVVALPALAQQRAEAPAADAPPAAVAVALKQFKVTRDAEGKERLVDASEVKPGDIVEYRATYTNRSGRPIQGLTADLPIPNGLAYLPRSASPQRVQAATRDGELAPEPIQRTANGKSEFVPYGEYRRLRWTLGQLPSNGVAVVSARTRVEPVAQPAPAAPAAEPPR